MRVAVKDCDKIAKKQDPTYHKDKRKHIRNARKLIDFSYLPI